MKFVTATVVALAMWSGAAGTLAFQSSVSRLLTSTILSSSSSSTTRLFMEPEDHHNVKVYPAKTNSALDRYRQQHAFSIQKPDVFWSKQAMEHLTWERSFDYVLQGDLHHGNIRWFSGGKLDIATNAIDRHVATKGDQVAILWEGDEPTDIRRITYKELHDEVSRIANALQSQGVRKGDVVTIYMPMIPELAMTMLACARIGAIHSVVFAGFSAEALSQRIEAAHSQYLVTADQGLRGGKQIPLKSIVNEARSKHDCDAILKAIFVWERFYNAVNDTTVTYDVMDKDIRMNPLVARQRPYCPAVTMDAEDPLFILYTSGSTGQPKGLVHTTGGYAVYAAYTAATTFDLTPGDIFACVADCGWITGHSYVVYGPLLNGATTFLFESTPLYPDAGRYWDMIQRHRITQFYTAPTAIHSLMQYGPDIPYHYDLSSLKILGTVGEPINAAAWEWYYQHIGKAQCTIVDTYWQTETGGHLITNLLGVTPMKPGSCTLPMYGIQPAILDPLTGQELANDPNGEVEGVLAISHPWPSMARTCLGDHERSLNTYLKAYPGYYFTGDSVFCDKDGYHFITGRVDDVLNVSGHRIGTAEIESALVAHPSIAQAAVVGMVHPIKSESIAAFVMLDLATTETPKLMTALRNQVHSQVGAFASPDYLWIAPSLPMTRLGKIMRRVLRKIVAGEAESLGDVSTLSDPSIVPVLIAKVNLTLQDAAAARK